MSLPHTRRELDAIVCDNPECEHTDDPELFIHGACHPAAPPWASYDRSRGALVFVCSVCGAFITAVAVASGVSDVRKPN